MMEDSIFIVGCSNSGTSMLQRMLVSHTLLCSTPPMSHPDDFGVANPIEVQDLDGAPDVMRHSLGRMTFRLWAHPQFKGAYYVTERDWTPQVDTEVRAFLAKLMQPGRRLVVKSPSYAMRVRLYERIFPGSSFIALVRNGYAVVEGIRRKRKLDPERPQLSGQETTVVDAALQWQYANTVIVSHQSRMKRLLIVRYEDLVSDPAGSYATVCSFLGLPPDDVTMLSFQQDLNDQQIARLTSEEIGVVSQYCWPMLRHFGYNVL